MGLPKFLTYLFLHATACGLRRIFTSLPFSDDVVLPSGPLRPSASATTPISKLYQHFRERGFPYGLQDSLSTLHLSCSPQLSRLRHRRKTRYGWVASPFPTGTFTLQDTPSFAWRDNGPAGDPAQVYRDRVHWSRWKSISIFPLSRAVSVSSLLLVILQNVGSNRHRISIFICNFHRYR